MRVGSAHCHMSSRRIVRQLNFSPVGVVLKTLIGNLVCPLSISKHVAHEALRLLFAAFELFTSERLWHGFEATWSTRTLERQNNGVRFCLPKNSLRILYVGAMRREARHLGHSREAGSHSAQVAMVGIAASEKLPL